MIKQKGSAESSNAFKERVQVWAVKVRVKPKQVRLQLMSRKWASCSTEGRVTFSLDLLEEASSFQDYVIVHELIHLKVPNHGKLSSSLLSAHLPGYKYKGKPEAKSRSL
jgi:predicted metal-dependent hydrolase